MAALAHGGPVSAFTVAPKAPLGTQHSRSLPHSPTEQASRTRSKTFQPTVNKVSASVLLAGAAARVGSRRLQLRSRMSVLNQRRSSELASEVQTLEREAAELRAVAAELEEAKVAEESAKRRRIFAVFDSDASGTISASELQRGMREQFGIELNDGCSEYIIKNFDKTGKGVLDYEEFEVDSVRAALERKWAGEESEMRTSEEETFAGANLDDGLLVRLCCVLAYIVPVMDGIVYSLPLCLIFPQLVQVVTPILELSNLVESVPFGPIITFCIMQYLSRREWVPDLLRYNLCQAVDIDIRVCLFGLFLKFAAWVAGIVVPFTDEVIENGMITTVATSAGITSVWVGLLVGVVAFFPFIASVIYSITWSLLGHFPRNIPMVSEEAERVMRLPTEGSSDDNEHA